MTRVEAERMFAAGVCFLNDGRPEAAEAAFRQAGKRVPEARFWMTLLWACANGASARQALILVWSLLPHAPENLCLSLGAGRESLLVPLFGHDWGDLRAAAPWGRRGALPSALRQLRRVGTYRALGALLGGAWLFAEGDVARAERWLGHAMGGGSDATIRAAAALLRGRCRRRLGRFARAAEDLALAEGIYGVRLTGQWVGLLAEWVRTPKAHDGKVSLGLCAPGETGLPPTVAFARVVNGFEEDLRHIAQEDPTSEDLLPALEAERDGNLALLRHLKAGDAARFSPAPWEKGMPEEAHERWERIRDDLRRRDMWLACLRLAHLRSCGKTEAWKDVWCACLATRLWEDAGGLLDALAPWLGPGEGALLRQLTARFDTAAFEPPKEALRPHLG